MPGERQFLVLLLGHLVLLGEVLGVGITEEVPVGGLAQPIAACLQLVWHVLVVILLELPLGEFVAVNRLASQRKLATGVLVRWLHVLVVAFESWELGLVGTQFRARTIAVEQIFRVWPLQLIPFATSEPTGISRSHIKMRTFQFIILLIMVDDVGDSSLLIEATLIDRGLGEIGFDDMQFAEMTAAATISADTLIGVVMREVGVGQFGGCLIE